jgi:methane/ammonia monooxygenase subunit B
MKQLIRLRTLGMSLLALITVTPSVFAHGERALEPFIRMRTIQWYDIAWSHTNLKVNDELILRGRFHVAEDWPNAVAKPDSAFLNLAMPTPVLVRTATYLNGISVANSVDLQLGADYEFKLSLKARIPGRYHIHPMMNLKDVGVIVGPGMWIEIRGAAADFRNETTTASGRTIDLETFGTRNGVLWHGVWLVLGAAWLLWWVRRPLFIPRYKLVQAGNEEALITPIDRRIAIFGLAATLVVIAGGYAAVDRAYPDLIPLQTGRTHVEPLPGSHGVGVAVKHATYRVVERSLSLTLEVTNKTAQPIQLAELNTATVRFFNPEAGRIDLAYPEELSARTGLRVESNAPIAPGEIRTVHVTATDAAWDLQKLSTIIKDADSRVGALLFFYDTSGTRYISSISTSVVPVMGDDRGNSVVTL